jgi:hypothetical protein
MRPEPGRDPGERRVRRDTEELVARAAERHSAEDPVEKWKRLGLAQALDTQRRREQKFPIRLRVTSGFVILALVAGAPFGLGGALLSLIILSSVIFVQELPRAWLARILGRSSRISISARGGHTEIPAPPFRGASAVAFSAVGSFTNLLTALVLNEIALHARPGPALAPILAAAVAHAAWGIAQVLPLLPFTVGHALVAGARPPLRFAHAAASSEG